VKERVETALLGPAKVGKVPFGISTCQEGMRVRRKIKRIIDEQVSSA
jgi:hypothetical protein